MHSNAERYGSDRSLLLLARGLVLRGWRVTVTVPAEGPLVAALRAAGAEVHHSDAAAFRRGFGWRWFRYLALDLPAASWRLRRLARRAEVVHVNTSISLGGVLGGFWARRPVVVHLRESYRGREQLFRAYGWLLRRTASRVVAISSDIRAEADHAGLGDRTVLIHNGLDLGEPPSSALSASGPVVTVGRINDWKGQLELVEALGLLRERGIRIPAAIAGDAFPGAEIHVQRLVATIERLGLHDQVRLLGFVDDVPALLATASMFVMPSTRPEPFGLALVEAMACGLPCVATGEGGPRDIIRDGETGRLVPCGDIDALAAAIESLWRSPEQRRRLGAAAAVDVRQRFSIAATVERVDALYRDLTCP